MQLLIKILLLFTLLISCVSSPEQKIKQDIKLQNRFDLKIRKVTITDTIYTDFVSNAIDKNTDHIKNYSDTIKHLVNVKDSIFKTKKRTLINDSLIRKGFHRVMQYNRKVEHYKMKIHYYEQLYFTSTDNIAGYYVKIETETDDYEFAVTSDFNVLCPKFMLE